MDVISLSAIKKAKKEIVDLLNKIDGQTLQSMVLELRNTLSKLDREKLSAADFNQMMASIQEHLASKLDASISSRLSKADFDRWKAPWTDTRAAKLDKLDAKVSSRLSKTDFDTGNAAVLDKVPSVKDWTPVRATKVDSLDATVSSRADGSYYTPARAVKLDSLDANITTRATQASVQDLRREVDSLKNRGTIKRVQRGWIQPGTGGWEKIRASTKYGGNFYEKEITLPYAVDVSKSKESATAFEYVSYSSNSGVGVTCFLSGSQKLILRIDEKSVSFDGNSNGICWTVEEWY